MLVLVSPGGIHERFVTAVGTPAAEDDDPIAGDAADVARVAAAAAKYGIEFVSVSGD